MPAVSVIDNTAAIDQNHYTKELVKNFAGTDHLNKWETPCNVNFKDPVPSQVEKRTKDSYQSLIFGLLWVAQCTWPDVELAVNRLSQLLQTPGSAHWKVETRVIGYLKGTKSPKLKRTGLFSICKAYSNADWEEDTGHEHKSKTGHVFKLEIGPILW